MLVYGINLIDINGILLTLFDISFPFKERLMITSKQAMARYGDPAKEKSLVRFEVPKGLRVGAIPKAIYCNKDLVRPLTRAFINVIDRGLADQIKTWDGCFNIRRTRNDTGASLHSWALAIDINSSWNALGKAPSMSKELVKCFTDAGFDWGGVWKTPDGMHFQLARFED